MQNLEQSIREKAYHLWIADGCQDGHSESYWLAAQHDILNPSLPDSSTAFAPPAKTEAVTTETKHPAKTAKASPAKRASKRRVA